MGERLSQSPNRIVSLEPLKQKLKDRRRIFTPLELYQDTDWKKAFDPEHTVYVTAAASSGGYRAYPELWGASNSPAWKMNGHLQHTVIEMNTALITDMVNNVSLPSELNNKSFVVPHEIGTNIPSEFGTLLGKNEANLMMQWMMRISGISDKTAALYYQDMVDNHQDIIDLIGDPTIPKPEKRSSYLNLINIFLHDKEVFKDESTPERPVSAVMLGLDWKNSLGSQLEAALALRLGIPIYEIAINSNSPNYESLIKEYNLEKIQDKIHLPTYEGAGKELMSTLKRDEDYMKNALRRLLKNIRLSEYWEELLR